MYSPPKTSPPTKPTDLMGFGKYANKTIAVVTQNDPAYIVWACKSVSGFSVPATTLAKCQERAEEMYERRARERKAQFFDYEDELREF